MGAFWRGEITLRQLRVLVVNLPPDSALHRARNDGQQWTNVEALLWQLIHHVKILDQRLVWHRGKRPRWPKWLQFPWSRNAVQIGDRGEATTEEVLAYLRSMSPKKKPK